MLRWQTGLEAANLGFNLYRDDAGQRRRVNANLIAGSAFFVGARTQSEMGSSPRGGGGALAVCGDASPEIQRSHVPRAASRRRASMA